jgi:CheY-like chemotaxis protein
VEGHALSRQLVAAASRAGQRGAELTGKLLAFSRRQSLAPEKVDPVAMLQVLADMLRRTLGENIRVVVQAPPHCAHCLVDALQLESALLNVAVNARDAMPKGGTILLRCGVGDAPEPDFEGPQTQPAALDGLGGSDGSADPQQARRWVWLSVQDDGLGMTPEVLDRAFEPFFTTKAVGRGTGLGLSTVYGFVKQSHGHISIDSAPGAGTTVTLHFPALAEPTAADAGASDTAAQSVPTHAGLRVLLVEDDDDVRGVAQSFLRSLGCEVVACNSAAAALAELSHGQRFELLFSDIRLGAGIDGNELAQRVVAQQPDIAVLLSSGFSRYVEGDHQGVPLRWPLLKKPYDREALARAIATCLPTRTA